MRSRILWALAMVGAAAVPSCTSDELGGDPGSVLGVVSNAGGAGGHAATSATGSGGGLGGSGGAGGNGGSAGGSAGVGGAGASSSSGSSASSSSSGGNCKTMCLGVECGMIPDGCGGTTDCGDCGGPPGEACIAMASPLFKNKVHDAVEQSKIDHPEYFDFNNTNPPGGSDNVAVVMPAEYDAYVVMHVDGNGDTCISDPNDAQEIRVKGAADAAENYRIRVLVGPNAPNGYCAYKYQSTCSPAGF